MVAIPDELLNAARQAGQDHIFDGWSELDDAQRDQLLQDAQALDFGHLRHAFAASQQAASEATAAVQPIQDIATQADLSSDERQHATAAGLQLVAEGKLAVLLLAGGQGTRLGSAAPKGCFDIGLPSGRSLFRLQAERILRLQRLAADSAAAPAEPKPLHWYVMTSPATDGATRQYFAEQLHFGLSPQQIHFFQQGQMPCVTEAGLLIMAAADRLAWAPDGNGGIYSALQRQGLLRHMAEHGVEAVDCVSVDNALVVPGDPLFAGYCWLRDAQCGAKVVAKAHPEERVGVFGIRNGAVSVVEYSELDPATASAADPATGHLYFNWSNVCMHYFRRSFLEAVAMRLHSEGKFHIARKAIPSINGPVKGIKLELFIFDTFPMADNVALLEVPRAEQFAPVKNAAGADSPATARRAVLDLHTSWVQRAGGSVVQATTANGTSAGDVSAQSANGGAGGVTTKDAASPPSDSDQLGVEVSPLLSYAGEGLQDVCNGHTFKSGTCIA